MIEVRAFVNYGLIRSGEKGYMLHIEAARKAEAEGKIEILDPNYKMTSITKAIEKDQEEEANTEETVEAAPIIEQKTKAKKPSIKKIIQKKLK